MLTVYVAGPYGSAELVRAIHERLCAIGCLPTSQWAESATGPEDFVAHTPEKLAAIAEANYADIDASDAIFVVDPDCRGQETLCELGHALSRKIPAVVVRPKPLSRFRRGVVRAESVDEGIVALAVMANLHEQGHRGFALARTVTP